MPIGIIWRITYLKHFEHFLKPSISDVILCSSSMRNTYKVSISKSQPSISMPPTMNTPKPKPGEHQLAGQYYWVSLTTMGPRQLRWNCHILRWYIKNTCTAFSDNSLNLGYLMVSPNLMWYHHFPNFPMFWGTSHFHPPTLDSHAALGAPSLIQAQCTWVHIHNQHIKHSIDSKCQMICIYIYIRASVEGPHSQSNVVATLHSIGKINKGIREY